MNKMPKKIPSSILKGFKNYGDFLVFAKMLFDLSSSEYKGLYNVLVKLQGVGENPVKTMFSWKNGMDEQDCLDLIRFMIQVESMDIGDIGKYSKAA